MRSLALLCLLMTACVLVERDSILPPERDCGKKGQTLDGQPCHCDRECLAEGTTYCMAEYAFGYPRGFCLHECGQDEECREGYVCSSFGRCEPKCETSSQCLPGRLCFSDGAHAGGVCQPYCDENSDCENGSCNRYSGRCNLYGEWPRGVGLGGACKEHEDCRSSLCAEGTCITFCDPVIPRCPDDGLCVAGICRNASAPSLVPSE